tara:strand:+ start:228 stop:593 length:366 start_codon:yes stop_codon:yes gene_type:complete
MITLTISMGDMEVDKMDQESSCPMPTQDPELNQENRQDAVEENGYRSPKDSPVFNDAEVCGNCEYYNQTTAIKKCLDSEDESIGYCQLLKFVCSAENTCNAWESGGPIKDDAIEYNKQDIL